jgi:hypothetical protein
MIMSYLRMRADGFSLDCSTFARGCTCSAVALLGGDVNSGAAWGCLQNLRQPNLEAVQFS